MKSKKKKTKGERRKILHQNLVAYSFLAPSLIGVICFSLIPLIISLYVSLTDWNFSQGLGNWNFIGLFLAIIMAVLIDEFCHKKIAGVVRVAMYMPHICNIVAISVVWMALYSKYGPFTQLMRALGWQDPPRFLASYEWALPAIMLVVIWASLGYRVFMYSAAITGLPRDLYEAAEIDGANSIQKFFKLTVPLLKPTTFFLTITGIISSFKVFGYTNVMTGGGPGSSTYTLVYYIYTSAFKYYKMGYASAIAVILFVMLLIVTIIQWVHNNKEEKG